MFSIFMGTNSSAQNYIVYSVKGEIVMNKTKEVKPGMSLKADDIIIIGQNSRIVILSEKEKRLYTIKTPGQGSLKQLFEKKENSFRKITDTYIAFLKKKISNADKVADKNYMQSAASSYREDDSTCVDIIISNAERDSTNNE